MSSEKLEVALSRLQQAKEEFKNTMCRQVDEMFADFVKELQSSLKVDTVTTIDQENIDDHKKMTEIDDPVMSFGRPPKEWLQEATAVLAQKTQSEGTSNSAKSTLLCDFTDYLSDDPVDETDYRTGTNLLYVLSSDDESNTDYLEETETKHNNDSKISAVF